MTPQRINECLNLFGWSKRGFAKLINRGEGTVRQWCRGSVKMPKNIEEWLENAASFIEKNPIPKREQQSDKVAARLYREQWLKNAHKQQEKPF